MAEPLTTPLTIATGTSLAVPALIAVESYNERIMRLPESVATGRYIPDPEYPDAYIPYLQDETDLQNAIDYFQSVADTERALRNFEGMIAMGDNVYGANNPRRPLGADSSYYIGSVWITPPYKNITTSVSGGSAQIILTGAVDAFRAVEGELVEFAIMSGNAVTVAVDGQTLDAIDGVYSFVMPDSAAQIAVEVIDSTEDSYTVTVSSSITGGSLTVDKTTARAGETVTVQVSPQGDKTLTANSLRYNGIVIEQISGVYSFTMPAANVTITAQFEGGTPLPGEKFTIETDSGITGGTLTFDKVEAEMGETITVTVTPDTGKRLVAGSLRWDGRAINADADGKYRFAMPVWSVTLTATFVDDVGGGGTQMPPGDSGKGQAGSGNIYASVWDGKSIDIEWFTENPNASSYTIYTPAQLAGLAALVNGLYNREIDTIAGDLDYLRVNTGFGTDSGPQGNNKSTDTWHFGDYNFAGVTIYLGADINMGSSNYMPIGGQYLMTPNVSATRIDASFCGVFDGNGHSVTINAQRHCSTGNYGDGQSVGLIGRLGVHDNEASNAPEGMGVRNVAVYSFVSANRSVGGIVGKIGRNSGGVVIENCANFAAIDSTDAKGVGGIVGAAWNGIVQGGGAVIRNCYNAGTVNATHTNPAGGIAGSVEIPIENCYSYGLVTAPSGFAMGIGSSNGGGSSTDSYYLTGSAADGGWYTGSSVDNSGERTADYMRSDDFVLDLGSAYNKAPSGVNSGYPVLAWQGGTPVTPDSGTGDEGGGSSDVPSETTVDDGSATTVIDDFDLPLSEYGSIFVVTVETNGEDINDFTAEISLEMVTRFAETGSSLRIVSDIGNVFLSTETLAGMAEGDWETLSIKFEKNDDRSYTVSLDVDGMAITSVDDILILSIPVDDPGPSAVAVLLNPDGTTEIMKKSVILNRVAIIVMDDPGTVMIIENTKSFGDVPAGEWYYNAVAFVTARNLFLGTSTSSFSPDAPMTRGMVATELWRIEDEITGSGGITFDDVIAGMYYSDAVAWASVNGIVEGYGNGRFAPDDSVTREQLVTMIHRYASNSEFGIDERF